MLFILLILLAVYASSVSIALYYARRADVGYEDALGYHSGKAPAPARLDLKELAQEAPRATSCEPALSLVSRSERPEGSGPSYWDAN